MARAKEYGAGEYFLTSDVVAAINASTDTGTDKRSLDVKHRKAARLWLYVKGANANCALAVDLCFQVSPDGVNWHDIAPLSVTLSGTAVVVDEDTNVALDLTDVNYIRLDRVVNHEAVAGRTATVNAWISGK